VQLEDAGHLACSEHPGEQLWAEGFPMVSPLPCPLGVTDVSV